MIEKLTESSEVSLEVLGGKGCGLVRLLQQGFPVPEVWCLRADSPWNEEQTEAGIRELASQIEELLPGTLLSVRSSATAEDLSDASFAGVYTTILGVRGADEMVAAWRTCTTALHSEQARAYREAKGLGHDVRMAVLFQHLLAPDVSGVLLTANPQRPFADEIVIDAAYGLGEGIVSGATDPDHLVLDRNTGAIREGRIGEKSVALRFHAGEGVVETTVVPEQRECRALSDTQIKQLFELAQQVGKTLSARRDLEWAFEGNQCFLLQVRAITSLPPEDPQEVWTRKFGDEYLADYTTPITRSTMVQWIRDRYFDDLARRAGRSDLVAMKPIRFHRGHAYLSGRYVVASINSTPVNMRQEALTDWFTPIWMKRVLAQPFRSDLFVRRIVSELLIPAGTLGKNLSALDQHMTRLKTEIISQLTADNSTLSATELADRMQEIDNFGRHHFDIVRIGMGRHNLVLHMTLKARLRQWAGDEDGELYQRIISGIPGTRTAEINHDIWRLSQQAREDEKLLTALRNKTPFAELREKNADSPFWSQFDRLLEVHGHRSSSRDLSVATWRETPEIVLGLIQAQVAGAEQKNPEALEKAAIERRLQATQKALDALGRGPIAALRRRILGWIIAKTHAFTVYRENQRYALDIILAQLRKLVLEHGRRLAAAGVLDQKTDAFLLNAPELAAVIANPAIDPELQTTVSERRTHWLKWRDHLPATFLFEDVETEGEIAEGNPPKNEGGVEHRVGLGASRGTSKGQIRVLEQVSDLGLIERGEILVARNIDPGWTGVFPLLSGLITETGGLLSHGALLAREYGIPAVMGVPGATKTYKTGDRVEIDGAQGSIELLENTK